MTKWTPRIYMLDDREIPSYDVVAELHKARKELDNCALCHKPISAGEKYIRLNYPWGWYFHKDCYLPDHSGDRCLIAVGTKRIQDRYGIRRIVVICRNFGKVS